MCWRSKKDLDNNEYVSPHSVISITKQLSEKYTCTIIPLGLVPQKLRIVREANFLEINDYLLKSKVYHNLVDPAHNTLIKRTT